jgi:2-polyprenyl-3-methyl-5-hydroxy-6-metoxy-1,4-benzoquinol methylase
VETGLLRGCPACRATRHAPWGVRGGYTWLACRACGSLFVEPVQLEDIPRIYDAHYLGLGQPGGATALALERVVRAADPFRSTGRWLDIGFGDGSLLSVAAAHGWSPHGTEQATSALQHAAERGWVVTADPLTDPRFPRSAFDVVSLVEVLEHVREPRRLLDQACAFLRAGGLLYATTPNALSLNRRVLGVGWSIFCAPEHLVVWTPGALRRSLEERGLRVLRLQTHGLNPTEIGTRLRKPRPGRRPPSRNEAAFALNEAFSRSPPRRWLKDRINEGLTLLRLGDDLKVYALGA